ncbi:hypothetical protein ACFFU2_06540 [Halomonas alkalicola]|uniref:hypothetical protein n=1 Tax=Halomonas TaxID=2745 RepID=UPI0013C2D98B|nr:hypothetical protein [Halomonas sp. JS92-SW72]
MATSIGLLAMLALLAAAGVFLLRGPRQKGAFGPARLVALVLAGLVLLFLVWMVVMVLGVGSHMRAM